MSARPAPPPAKVKPKGPPGHIGRNVAKLLWKGDVDDVPHRVMLVDGRLNVRRETSDAAGYVWREVSDPAELARTLGSALLAVTGGRRLRSSAEVIPGEGSDSYSTDGGVEE